MPAAAPPVRPPGLQGRHDVDIRPHSRHSLLSLALSSLGRNNRAPLPPPLRRARARSPPHYCPQKLVHSSALKPSTSSSAPRSQPSRGRVAFPFSAAAVPRRRPSARRLSVARGLWASPSPASGCVRVEVDWGCSPRVRDRMSGSPTARCATTVPVVRHA
jgi:hypothetical protein